MWRVCIAPLPYSVGFLIYVISEWFANIIVGTVLAVVFLRVLHVVKVFYSSLKIFLPILLLEQSQLLPSSRSSYSMAQLHFAQSQFAQSQLAQFTFALFTFDQVTFCLGNFLPSSSLPCNILPRVTFYLQLTQEHVFCLLLLKNKQIWLIITHFFSSVKFVMN